MQEVKYVSFSNLSFVDANVPKGEGFSIRRSTGFLTGKSTKPIIALAKANR
jgi:hypothetical protein